MYNIISNNNLMSIIKLTRSLIIKSHAMAVHMNIQLEKDFGVSYNSNDMTTWPYYLNLSGEPHSSNSPISLISLDTDQEFVLDKNLRDVHPKTFKELDKKEDFYNELISQYPMQELYILGMLYPIDIDDAIGAEDGKILYYDSSYLEYNEQSLIDTLEVYIQGYMSRWLNEEFVLTDDLYMSGFWATLIGYIVKKIYLIRYNGIGNESVNNYYKTAILNSYMGLGVYADVLSKKSLLWLVKNIPYISYNIGSDSTLSLIIDKIFRDSNIYVDEILLEPISVTQIDSDVGPSYTIESDNVYKADYGTNKLVKYDIDELVSEFKIYSDSEESTVETRVKADTVKITSNFRDIETKTKFLILTDRDSDVMNISYRADLLFDVIVKELNSDDDVVFIINNERTVMVTKKDILKSFIYLLISQNQQIFTVTDITLHSLILDTESSYYINYSPIMEYLKLIEYNINSILSEQESFISGQDKINTYIKIERANLTDDFFRYEFDRYINSLRKTMSVPIDINEDLNNIIIESGTKLDDLFASICILLEIEIPSDNRVNKFKDILDRLTSYTLNIITNTNIVDASIPDHTMKLEGPTIMTITDIELDCNGAIAKHDVSADTEIERIYKTDNNILIIEDVYSDNFAVNAYRDDLYIIKEKVIMDVVDAGV